MARLEHLKRRHSWLEHEIAGELARRMPDDARIGQLKKLKLAIKDRMLGLKSGSGQSDPMQAAPAKP